ncbi:penicillin-binding protein activator [Kordiimonas pumila]|uniref:Penicillin-binding protein activator n=1 Tax=Kordiimonas pumila TaxID=2161677 RepID=A0ABV7DAJ8_9PROT|nr:penicillin-binding protein activator [Kordiimonas pumila]
MRVCNTATLLPLLWLCAVLSLSACGPSKPEPTPTVTHHTKPEQITPTVLLEKPVDQTTDTPEKITIAILLPLSGPESVTGKALLKSATMALFDAYDPRLILLPIDTKADVETAARAAQQAVDAGASVILGPLLSANVRAAGAIAVSHGIPLVGFSNDSSAAAPGQFIMGFMPESEVKRVVDYARKLGRRNFAALIPDGRYGNKVNVAYGEAVSDSGGSVVAIESYPRVAAALFDPVKRLANYDNRKNARLAEIRYLKSLGDDVTDELASALEKNETLGDLPYDTVLLPEGGALLQTLAPLLPFYEIDPNKIKLLGTGLWNDPDLLREPPLQGAIFAAPQPEAPTAFMKRYRETYEATPPRIATLAYDAVSLVALMAREDANTVQELRFSQASFTRINGFAGVDGLFRFLPDGTVERMLSVLEINSKGFVVADPAPSGFPQFGYALRQ